MLWKDLLGHEQQLEWFRTAAANNRLATSFLFVGPPGIGKRTFARLLAKSLLCRANAPSKLEPCGRCEDCAQVDASTHPDLIELSKPADKSAIPIELLIGEREKRMREGLCHDISLKPYSGRRKIAILDDADALNVEGANCLLKTLEEPPTDSLLILIGTGLHRQLRTIRSRCQSIVFRPLSPGLLVQLVERGGMLDTQTFAGDWASQLGGSLEMVPLLADEDYCEFRSSLLKELVQRPLPFAQLAKNCAAAVEAVGKEARLRRERMRLVFSIAAELYRGVVLFQFSQQKSQAGDALLRECTQRVASQWTAGLEGAVGCWKRCLAAIEQVERNANQTALLESWAADLAALSNS